MNTDVKAVHFSLDTDSRDYLDRKVSRIPNAEKMILDLLITFTKTKDFSAAATVNFTWGGTVNVKDSDFDLTTAIDKLINKLEAKIIKEKEKTHNGRELTKEERSGILEEEEEEVEEEEEE